MVVNLYVDKYDPTKDLPFIDTCLNTFRNDERADFELCVVDTKNENDPFWYFLDEKGLSKENLPVLLVDDTVYNSKSAEVFC